MIKYESFPISVLLFGFLIVFPQLADLSTRTGEETIKYNVVHSWAEKLGVELWHLGDLITRRKDVQESFKQAQIVPRVGQKIVENMANDIKFMMELKVSAVRRIMDTAENTALSFQNSDIDNRFDYYNSKLMLEPGEEEPKPPPPDSDKSGVEEIILTPKRIILTQKSEFFDYPVNISMSAVHVPTNVFDRADNVIKDIQWSENLDGIFRDNFKIDPTLSWQFFGSFTGFMRQFPATKWKEDPVDLYDCRLRSWYIEAATSPKDVIILMDTSGSMMGQRKDIAKHVVFTILDTLGTNDFVNIFTFSEEVTPIVPCFDNDLVQANLGNIRELKLGLENPETEHIANFTAALITAFEILARYRTEGIGAHCNQAIMLISDGAPYGYRDIFEEYNRQESDPFPVRVFTYLIGKEVADVKEIKAMACENHGFYVHLSDLAEVREQVLNYIPVMARPLVLGKHDHPVIWTQVYADIEDPQMTDWLWEVKESQEQKQIFLTARINREVYVSQDDVRRHMKQKKLRQQPKDYEKYHFMTTVAMPVYDRRENATKIANLLGVAGTDVPIRDIKRLMMPFMLGVNGYAFIVTNNGYILVHPDFRPVFEDILKPAYNSIDMMEVELLDDDHLPRDFNDVLLGIRESIINQSAGSKWLLVKYHFDDMKRVSRIKRQYFWTAIQNTPFTLVVTYPEQYGLNRIQIRSEDEIHRIHVKGSNVLSFFDDDHWKIHPDWLYCKHGSKSFSSPESELLYFLDRMKSPGWKWPLNRTPPPPEHVAMYCDRNLMQALVFDARVTEWFSKNSSLNSKDDKGNEFKQRFGITVAFLATHSGLTRWQEIYTTTNVGEEARPEQEFSENNRRAIDEVWYKRAVEQHFVEQQSFVYSVPFDNNPNDTLVTASHAIFHSEGGKAAPVAVVGFQFQHSALIALFRNITNNCVDCTKTCASKDIECYILDNNGYILISPNVYDTGKFFGEIRGALMQRLVEENVYKKIMIYDYQAVCFPFKSMESASNFVLSPLLHIFNLIKWFGQLTIWAIFQYQLGSAEHFDTYVDDNYTDQYYAQGKAKQLDYDPNNRIRRTRPQSCDQELALYALHTDKDKTIFKTPASACERPFVVMPIPASNLILLIVDVDCPIEPSMMVSTAPVEIFYNLSLACYKSRYKKYPRIKPSSCINKHENESQIQLCGDASCILVNYILILITLSVMKIL